MDLPTVNTGFIGILKWFRKNYKTSIPQWKIDYITQLCLDNDLNLKCKYIDDFIIGKSITNLQTQSTWTIDKPSGIEDYDSRFKPDFTPDVMIRMGIFGGLSIKGIESEIPIEWILFALVDDKVRPNNTFQERNLNFYDVIAEPFPINTIDNMKPKNFFHWYVRYYLGKRCDEDEYYITKWEFFTTYLKNIIKKDPSYHYLIIRQTLLQWGCDS